MSQTTEDLKGAVAALTLIMDDLARAERGDDVGDAAGQFILDMVDADSLGAIAVRLSHFAVIQATLSIMLLDRLAIAEGCTTQEALQRFAADLADDEAP